MVNCEKCGMRTDIKGMDSCFCGDPEWKPYEPYTQGILSTHVCSYVYGSGGTCVEKVENEGDRCCEQHEIMQCQHPSGNYDKDGNEVCDHCGLMVYGNTAEKKDAAYVNFMTKFQDDFIKGRQLATSPMKLVVLKSRMKVGEPNLNGDMIGWPIEFEDRICYVDPGLGKDQAARVVVNKITGTVAPLKNVTGSPEYRAFANPQIGEPWMNPKEEFFHDLEGDLTGQDVCQNCSKEAVVWAKDVYYSTTYTRPTMGGYTAVCGDCYFDWWDLIETSIQDPDLLILPGWGQTISMWENSVSPEERQRAAVLDPAYSYELRVNEGSMAPYFGDRIIGPCGEALIVRNVYLHRSDLSGPYLALECATGEIFGAADCELRSRALLREARPPFITPGITNVTLSLASNWEKEAMKENTNKKGRKL